MRWIVVDFESASAADLKVVGAYRYWEDITTEVLCLAWEDDRGRKGLWRPGQGLPDPIRIALEDGWVFVAHNAQFEKAAWASHMVPVYGWPPLSGPLVSDTLARCANIGLPLGLDEALRALRLDHEKDAVGNKLTISLSRLNKKTGMYPARTDEVLSRVYQYCESDVTSQVALHRRVGWLSKGEQEVFHLNQRINDRGIRLDMAFVRACRALVEKASTPLAAEFTTITGFNIGQSVAVKKWVIDQGVDIPNLQKETLAKLLGEDDEEDTETDEELFPGGDGPVLPDHVERALRIRQLIGSASIKKLARMETCVCADGRARGLLQYHGTGPGRSAGRLLQPQNFPRGTINAKGKGGPEALVEAILTEDPEYVGLLFGPPVEVVVSSLRHAIIADYDKTLVAVDYAGIQARVVLALAGQHDKTAIMAAGKDIYCDMASDIYGREITKDDTVERQTGKNSVLGLGFQMGWKKFRLKYCADQPEEFAQRVVDAYRKVWAPCVPKLWEGLDRASFNAVADGGPHEAYGVEYRREDQWLTARLPSGRKLWYFDPRIVSREMPWSTYDKPDFRDTWTFRARKSGQFITVDAFGGLMAENAVMGIERDIMMHGTLMAEKNGFPPVLEVHDEGVFEPLVAGRDPDKLLKECEQILVDVPDWVRTLKVPIAVEGWHSHRYRK